MPFTDGPVLMYLGAGTYETVGPTIYVGNPGKGGDVINIPAGFRTDLASIPRMFWAVLPPTGAYEKSAVAHDFLCTEAARCYREGTQPKISPRDIDGLWRRMLREADDAAREHNDRHGRIRFVTRWVLWSGVRWGALFDPARRPGVWRDMPLVATITAVEAAVVVGVAWGVHALIDIITG